MACVTYRNVRRRNIATLLPAHIDVGGLRCCSIRYNAGALLKEFFSHDRPFALQLPRVVNRSRMQLRVDRVADSPTAPGRRRIAAATGGWRAGAAACLGPTAGCPS